MLVVVDDGSTDGTPQAVSQWIDQRPLPFPVRLLRQTNHGAPHARNRGIAATPDCRYYAFLDSDDLWPRDFLERMSAVLDANPAAVAASCDQTYVSLANGQKIRHESLAGIVQATRWLFENAGGVTCCSIYRARAIRQLGGFDETLLTGQDLDLFLQLSLLGPWRYAAGMTVTIRRDISLSRREEMNLSDKYPDRLCRWVRIEENFVECKGGRSALPVQLFRAKLSWDWYRAGKELLRQGQVSSARHCLRRAVRWRISNRRAWVRLVQAYLMPAA
jgi:glycosyltransferase involved in cell wall biosynthesis